MGSTARLPESRANALNLNEELVIKEIKSNPLLNGKTKLDFEMTDPRWLSKDGWGKYQYIHKLSNGEKINVHYLVQIKNGIVQNIDDIKFKLK